MEHVAVSDTDMSQFARINDDAAPHSYSLTDDVEIHNHRAILDSCDIDGQEDRTWPKPKVKAISSPADCWK